MKVDLSKELGKGHSIEISEHEGIINSVIEIDVSYPGQKEKISIIGERDGEAFVIGQISGAEGPTREMKEFKYKQESLKALIAFAPFIEREIRKRDMIVAVGKTHEGMARFLKKRLAVEIKKSYDGKNKLQRAWSKLRGKKPIYRARKVL